MHAVKVYINGIGRAAAGQLRLCRFNGLSQFQFHSLRRIADTAVFCRTSRERFALYLPFLQLFAGVASFFAVR